MGIERTDPKGKCAKCGKLMTATHARRCGGSMVTRHNGFGENFAIGVKREAQVPLMHVETDCCFKEGYKADNRMDLVIEGGQMTMPGIGVAAAQYGAAIDFAIVDPTASAYITQAELKEGAAAEAKALVKRNNYSTPLSATSYTFFALVIEVFGAASQDVHKLVGALAARQAAASNGMYALSHCVNRWRQRLSVCVRNQVSAGVIYEWALTQAIEIHEPQLDKWAYARRRLLLPPVAAPAEDFDSA